MADSLTSERIIFEPFEVDLAAEELWRGMRKVRCQRQPFRVLRALLERPGQLVTREELQQAIWGLELPADADHSLGIAVTKLREASPEAIRETIERGCAVQMPLWTKRQCLLI